MLVQKIHLCFINVWVKVDHQLSAVMTIHAEKCFTPTDTITGIL